MKAVGWLLPLSFMYMLSPCFADLALFTARYGGDSSTYCAAYDSSVTTLPITLEEEFWNMQRETPTSIGLLFRENLGKWPGFKNFYPLLDVRPSTLCQLPNNSSDFEGRIVEIQRNSSAPCHFNDSASNAEDAGASGVLIVSYEGIFEPNLSNASLEIPVVLVSSAGIDHLYRVSNGQNIQGSFYAPDAPVIFTTMLAIMGIAVMVVVIGGYWSGITAHEDYLKKTLETEMNTPDRNDSKEADKEDKSVQLTTPVILVMVALIVTTLLLLYFFFSIFVYVIIVMFCLGSWSGLYQCVNPIVKKLLSYCPGKSSLYDRIPPRQISICKQSYEISSIVLCIVTVVPPVIWFVYRHSTWSWILLDILGMVFCISVYQSLIFSNLKNCAYLLLALFVYDIFFVFITPLIIPNGDSIMVKVATGGGDSGGVAGDAYSKDTGELVPMLFKVPHFGSPYGFPCQQYALLGFGDVLVPGFLMSYLHAFDLKVGTKKLYFISSIIAYILALVMTFSMLLVMGIGQPALLYIVPFTLGITVIIGALRKEFKNLWHGDISVVSATEDTTPNDARDADDDGP